MKEVAKNEFYELGYDETQNWIHWTMRGFWKSMAVVPDFDKDWDAVQSMVKPGWKLFADLAELKPMPDDVQAAQDARQQKLIKDGCAKVSCIMTSAVTRLSLNKVLKDSGMDKIIRYVDNAEDGETFLNEA